MKNLYAIHATGFPERFAQGFLADVLDSLAGNPMGEPVLVKRSGEPTQCEYAAFFETNSASAQGLAKLIVVNLRHYMTNRGNRCDEGAYKVVVAPIRMEVFCPVGRYDETLDGYV